MKRSSSFSDRGSASSLAESDTGTASAAAASRQNGGFQAEILAAVDKLDTGQLQQLLQRAAGTAATGASGSALVAAVRRAAQKKANQLLDLLLKQSPTASTLNAAADAQGRTAAHWLCRYADEADELLAFARAAPAAFSSATVANAAAAAAAAAANQGTKSQRDIAAKFDSLLRFSSSAAASSALASKSAKVGGLLQKRRRRTQVFGDADEDAEVEEATACGEVALHWAARFVKDEAAVVQLLQLLPDLAVARSEIGGNTPLLLACAKQLNLLPMLQQLLPKFHDAFDVANDRGETAVHAASRRSPEAALLLLHHLPLRSCVRPDATGTSAIDCGISAAGDTKQLRLEVVQRLQKALASADMDCAPALLHSVARMPLDDIADSIAGVKELRSQLQISGFAGETLLHLACLHGSSRNIRLLTRRLGLRLADADEAGRSCVDFAYERGHQAAVFAACDDMDDAEFLELLQVVDPSDSLLPVDVGAEKVRASYQSLAGTSSVEQVMFRRAFELDDSSIFRSLLQLQLLTDSAMEQTMSQLASDPKLPAGRVAAMQLPSASPIDFALASDKVNIVLDFAISRQTDIIATCLRFLIQMREQLYIGRGKRGQLQDLRNRLVSLVANSLDAMYLDAEQDEKQLLFEFLRGSFVEEAAATGEGSDDDEHESAELRRNGPGFEFLQMQPAAVRCDTAFGMIQAADCDELFGTVCVSEFVDSEWRRRVNFLPQHLCLQQQQQQQQQQEQATGGFTYRMKFAIHALAFVVNFSYFSWYVIAFNDIRDWVWPHALIFLLLSSLLSEEISDIWQRRNIVTALAFRKTLRVPQYLTDSSIIISLLSLSFLTAGCVTNIFLLTRDLSSSYYYASQMLFATANLLFGIRALSFLRFFPSTGPLIVMTETMLVRDLIPFLAVLIIILISFGVFLFALLWPSGSNRPLHGIATLPIGMMFENYDTIFDNVVQLRDGTNTTVNPTGKLLFDRFLLFLFLGLVNIVMINLLIALFSESVSNVKVRSYILWRKTRWAILREYRRKSLLPPPLSVLEFFASILWPPMRSYGRGCQRVGRATNCCERLLQLLPLLPCCLPCSCCWFLFQGAKSCCSSVSPKNQKHWLWTEQDCEQLPQRYRKFLSFQANTLRSCRRQLLLRTAATDTLRPSSSAAAAAGVSVSDNVGVDTSDVVAKLANLEAAGKRLAKSMADSQAQLRSLTDNVQLLTDRVQELSAVSAASVELKSVAKEEGEEGEKVE